MFFNINDDVIWNFFSIGMLGEFLMFLFMIFFVSFYGLVFVMYGILVLLGLFVLVILCGVMYGWVMGMVMISVFGDGVFDEGIYVVFGVVLFLGGFMSMMVFVCIMFLELINNLLMFFLMMVVFFVFKIVGDLINDVIFDFYVNLKGFLFLDVYLELFMCCLLVVDVIMIFFV